MNILIVESENDQYFVEALVAEVINSETEVCKIDEFQHSSLSEAALIQAIENALTTRGISKIGILLDMDDKTEKDRIDLVNKCLKSAVKSAYDTELTIEIDAVGKFIPIQKDELITLQVACYFTNVDGNGELETVLKSIADEKNATFANCLLEGWQTCFLQKGKKIAAKGQQGDITEKEVIKLWVDFYKRFDTLKKGERNESTTDWKGIWTGETQRNKRGETKKIKPRGKDIFNLHAEILSEITAFLQLFN